MSRAVRTILNAITILFIFFHIGVAHAQKIVVNNRDDLSVSIGYAVPLGTKFISNEPALLANMKPGTSASIRYVTALRDKFHVGADFNRSQFEGWGYADNSLFQNASMSFHSFGPTVAYRTWSPIRFFQNRINSFAALTPGISKIEVRTDRQSEINEGTEINPLEVSAYRMFIRAEAGVNLNVSQHAAILIFMDYQYTSSNSKIFTDKSYSFLSFKVGASLRLAKDKQYKLSY
jgi:hypothetical protein